MRTIDSRSRLNGQPGVPLPAVAPPVWPLGPVRRQAASCSCSAALRPIRVTPATLGPAYGVNAGRSGPFFEISRGKNMSNLENIEDDINALQMQQNDFRTFIVHIQQEAAEQSAKIIRIEQQLVLLERTWE